MSEQPPFSTNSDNSTPLATGWRIAIGVAAIAIIAIMGWQIWGNQPVAEPPISTPPHPTAAAKSTPSTAEPASAKVFFQQGNTYYQSGQLDNAVTAFKKAIEIDPDYVAAYANLGAVYYAMQNLTEAENAYRQAIKLAPNDGDLLYNLSAIYIQEALAGGNVDQDKLALATEQIDKAISLNPNLAAPYYGRGVIKSYTGDVAGAIQDFEKFLELDDGSDPKATNNATALLKQLRTTSGQQ